MVDNIKDFMKLTFHINAGSETMEIEKARFLRLNGTFTIF